MGDLSNSGKFTFAQITDTCIPVMMESLIIDKHLTQR